MDMSVGTLESKDPLWSTMSLSLCLRLWSKHILQDSQGCLTEAWSRAWWEVHYRDPPLTCKSPPGRDHCQERSGDWQLYRAHIPHSGPALNIKRFYWIYRIYWIFNLSCPNLSVRQWRARQQVPSQQQISRDWEGSPPFTSWNLSQVFLGITKDVLDVIKKIIDLKINKTNGPYNHAWPDYTNINEF